MNKIFLIGNLTKDPELKTTAAGKAVCRFSIAVNRDRAGADGEKATDYFNVTAWEKTGELIAKYCGKGKKVMVEGRIQMRTYDDNSGVTRTAVDVIAQSVEFLTPAANPHANGDGNGNRKSVLEPIGDADLDEYPF